MSVVHDSLTRNQRLVQEELIRAREPLSAYTILDRLKSQGLNAAPQVYRALNKLIERGVVHRLQSRNAFVACQHAQAHSPSQAVAFAICESCGQVEELAAEAALQQLSGALKRRGFEADEAVIELSGQCMRCRL